MDLEQEIKKLEKEYADLRKIFDDTVGKLVSEKIAREITYATEIEQLTERIKNSKHNLSLCVKAIEELTERNKQLEAALRWRRPCNGCTGYWYDDRGRFRCDDECDALGDK